MSVVKAEMEGLQKLRANFLKQGKAWKEALGAAIYQKGLRIMAVAIPLTPIEFSPLRASGYVAPPRGDDMEVEIGFGTKYALPVHERLEVHHDEGQAKYLSTAVQQERSGYAAWLNRRAQANKKKGIGVKAIPATAPVRPKDTSK